ncbi:MAG TPA: 30S ribosomal protein S6 [Anaerolineaceae bacterium]|nr:30S ribosomal protein S6 [Anaerolineaceae bacterium]
MRTYELVLIFHPELDENALNEALEKVKGWITASGGSISKVDAWGKKRLAYVIRKQREGQYFLLTAEIAPAFTAELDRNLRFHEPVIRYMITAVE